LARESIWAESCFKEFIKLSKTRESEDDVFLEEEYIVLEEGVIMVAEERSSCSSGF